MAMKEHPFLVTTTFEGDGTTIKYDATRPNRSDAVGKAFKINASGKGELVGDGDAIEGKVLAVDNDHRFTAAYIFGGLSLPLGSGATVARGDKIVGALGTGSAKGYVKAMSTDLTVPDDLDDVASTPTQAEHNAVRQAVNSLKDAVETVSGYKGKGAVLEFDTTHALVAFPG